MSFTYCGPKTNLNDFLFNNRDYYDVEIETIDKKLIRAHKIILASKIEYFNNLFKMEKKDKYQIMTTYNVFNEIVRYAYNNCYEFNHLDDLMECLLFTDQIVYTQLFDQLLTSLDPAVIDKPRIVKIIGKLAGLKVSDSKKIMEKINELSSEQNDLKEINELCQKSICDYNKIRIDINQGKLCVQSGDVSFTNLPDFKKYGINKVYIIPIGFYKNNPGLVNFKLYVDKRWISKDFPWINQSNFNKIFKENIEMNNIKYYIFGSDKKSNYDGQYVFNFIKPLLNEKEKEFNSNENYCDYINYHRCKKFIKWHLNNLKQKEYNDIVQEFEL